MVNEYSENSRIDNFPSENTMIKYVRIVTSIPFSYPISQSIMNIKEKNYLVKITFNTIKRIDKINELFGPFEIKGVDRVQNDRFGQLRYMDTIFLIDIGGKKANEIIKEETNLIQNLLEVCAASINKISTGYRLGLREYFPRNFTKNDILGFEISYSPDSNIFYYTSKRAAEGSNSFLTGNINPHKNFRINQIITDYIDNIPLNLELIINAEDFYRENNYRMAVIEIETAVEFVISKLIENNFSDLVDKKIKDLFVNDLLKKRVEDKKPYLNAVSMKIAGTLEWNMWKKDCHEIRNDVIHKNKNPSQEEARKAIDAGKKFIELAKNYFYNSTELMYEGLMLYLSNNLTEGKKYLDQSLVKDPNNHKAMSILAEIYGEEKKYYKSICFFKQAINIKDDAEYYFGLGNIYRNMKLTVYALDNYNTSISKGYIINDSEFNPQRYKVEILMDKGMDKGTFESSDLKEIVNCFHSIEAYFPFNYEIKFNIGYTYYLMNENRKGIEFLSESIKLFPNFYLSFYFRSCCKIKKGEINSSLDDLEKSIKLNKNIIAHAIKNRDFFVLKDNARFHSLTKIKFNE